MGPCNTVVTREEIVPAKTATSKMAAVLFLIVSLCLVILVFQNWAPIQVQVLFKTVEVAPALLIAGAWLMGAVTGRPLSRWLWKRLRGESGRSSPPTGTPAGSPPPPTS